MHGNPCLATAVLVSLPSLPAGLVSELPALLRPSQLSEYRSNLYLGEAADEVYRAQCRLRQPHCVLI